ncbi:MAG: biosynthetic-type acetolactate synthase large subunit [Bryobacterales bacterium]|nr:biosynthetic-type acetolactate synthase large subunit [Bryobacterales bacterium]MDE0620988.1 biosynthetic-type acetolactate synthase large subunit [Bryobacterales bacterium]
MAMLSGAQILIESLVREGAEAVFGYPGGVTLPIYDVLYSHPLRHVLVRHEQNAAFAAQGYARATGKAGVCMATSGPGATNLTTGLVDALMDSIPVVAITGQVPQALIGRDAFQEADTFGISRSATKHNYLVKDIGELSQTVHEAFHIAVSGRPGPVLVDVTKDVLLSNADYSDEQEMEPLRGYRLTDDPDPEAIERAVEFLWRAERPYIYAGGGVISSSASAELVRFSELLEAPLAHTVMGLGAMPTEHPNFISMLGMHGSYAANMGVTECDALIGLGVRFDDRVTGRLDKFAPGAKVLHVDIDPAEINKNRRADLGVVGDAKPVLRLLNERLAETRATLGRERREARLAWMEHVRAMKRDHPYLYEESAEEIKPQALMRKLDQISGGEAIVTVDVGQHQMWAAQHLRFNHPRLWQSSSGLGAMGFGLPAAMGAKFACPDKTVIAIVGDGGFMMSLPELGTIAANRLPVKIVVMNNNTLGMVRQWQQLFYDKRYSEVDVASFPDASLLAAAFGIAGGSVTDPADLDDALAHAFDEPGPYLLNVQVTPEECVYPMVPSGGAVNEMILQPEPEAAEAVAGD